MFHCFGKEVQLISGLSYAETEKPFLIGLLLSSRLASLVKPSYSYVQEVWLSVSKEQHYLPNSKETSFAIRIEAIQVLTI